MISGGSREMLVGFFWRDKETSFFLSLVSSFFFMIPPPFGSVIFWLLKGWCVHGFFERHFEDEIDGGLGEARECQFEGCG